MSQNDLAQAFREAFRCHPAGVAVITAQGEAGPIAMTVSSLISVNADPPIVGFSLSARSGSTGGILAAQSCVIHLMRLGNLDLARLGATPGADRFGPRVAWSRLPTGEPRYHEVSTWFRAKIIAALPVTGANVVLAELLEGAAPAPSDRPEEESLIYLDRRWHSLREKGGRGGAITYLPLGDPDIFH